MTRQRERPMSPGRTPPFLQAMAIAQAAYLLFGGLWPLLHMRSFVAVTGPKVDLWLVRTVAGLLVVIGGTLAREAGRGAPQPGTCNIAAGTSLVLGLVSLFSAAAGRIRPIYLLDGAIHLSLVMGWAIVFIQEGRRRGTSLPS